MTYRFARVNFNVCDLAKSIAFYEQALGLKEIRRLSGQRRSEDGGDYVIVYLGDGYSGFELELTWLADHPQEYDLGEGEFHLALTVGDYEASLRKHREMGCICFVNDEMGIYFIEDPDGYWIEIIPEK